MAITLDGATKRIILDSTSHTAAEIWSRWVDWHASNTQWPLAFQLVGGQALGGGLFIPPYFFLLNGWRVRPMESNHNLTITGNLFVDGGGVPVVATLGTYQVNVNYTVPVQAQGISTSGSTGPTAAEIADEVRVELTAELSALTELWRRHGLDIAAPLTQTASAITAGTIDLAITGDPDTSVTVTRQP